jgi:hypothetical protein
MTYYPDLSPYEYRPDSVRACNVGWLDENYPFPTGPTSTAFHERLLVHCRFECTVHHYFGLHECQFCASPEPQVKVPWGDEQISLGNGEIRVIGTDVVYAAPTLIYHYVVDHDYQPPEEFVEAVLTGPGPGSDEHQILLSMIKGEFKAPDLPPEVEHRLVHEGGETEAKLAPDQLARLLDAARAGQPLTLNQLAQVLRAHGPQLEADTVSSLLQNTPIKRPQARRALKRSFEEYEFGLIASLDLLVQSYQLLDELVAPRQRDAVASQLIDDLKAGNWKLRAPLPYFLKEYARAAR